MGKGRRLKYQTILVTICIIVVISLFMVFVNAASNLLGDVNGDGTINSTDEALLQRHLLGITNLSDTIRADLNGDSKLNSTDSALLQRYLLGSINTFPAQSNVTTTQTATVSPTKTEATLTGDITFSIPSGTFQNSVSVSLKTSVANAQIRYTTDGKVPTSSSTLYSSSISITKTTQLRAQSFVNGAATGAMGTAMYVATNVSTKHDLPIIILDDYGAGKPDKVNYKDTTMMVIEPTNNEATILKTPSVVSRAGLRVRGQSSSNFEKTPYRIELRDNEDKDAKMPILGMPADSDWAILSPFPDKSLMRNPLAYELGKSIGLNAPRYKLVEVYINFDNQAIDASDYQGVYTFVETIKGGSDRLPIKKLKKADIAEPDVSGGYLMQFNMMAAEEPLIKGTGWSDLELKEPSEPQQEQLTYIQNYIQKTQNAIHSSNPSDTTTGYPSYIDVDSFVNYIIHNELAKEADTYMRSTYIYKDRNKKLTAGPIWDYDLAYDCFVMGSFGGGSASSTEGWQFKPGFSMGSTTCDWYYTLMKDPSFQAKISARWQELRKGPLSDSQIASKITSISSTLTNASKRNFQKWNNLNTSQVGGFGTQTTQTWEQQITILQNYFVKRAAWLDKSGWKPN